MQRLDYVSFDVEGWGGYRASVSFWWWEVVVVVGDIRQRRT